jgi:AcrR family transcriptional regulator
MKTRSPALPAPSVDSGKKRTRLLPEVRRQQILGAALVEFTTWGFTAASISRIARRAGMSRGNLYVHFADKDDMFETLLEGLLDRSQGNWSRLQEVRSADEFIDRFIDTVYAGLTDETIAITRLLITEGHRVPQLLSRWSAMNARARADRQAQIDRMVSAGVLAPSPLTEHFSLVMAPVVYSAVTRMVLGSEDAAAEVQAVKDTHRKLLALLLTPTRPLAAPSRSSASTPRQPAPRGARPSSSR